MPTLEILQPSLLYSTHLLHCAQKICIPYARHYNPLLIRNRSWILTIHKARILRKKPFEKTFLDFKKWVKIIQTAGYNGARTVIEEICNTYADLIVNNQLFASFTHYFHLLNRYWNHFFYVITPVVDVLRPLLNSLNFNLYMYP